MLIKELPEPFKQMAYDNQTNQGNPQNGELHLGTDKKDDGFSYASSFEGSPFWSKVKLQKYQDPDVLQKIRDMGMEFYGKIDETLSLDDVMNEINSL
jgi:hypothetical protein